MSGGLGSMIAGGKFWDGFKQGVITAALNHFAHEIIETKTQNNRNIKEDKATTSTVVIDKSVPVEEFGNIAIISEEGGILIYPDKYGDYDDVDGLFLRNQPEDKSWFKISDGAKATVYYNSNKGLYIHDTTHLFNPVRFIFWKYYVDWVSINDKSRIPPAQNPF